jgi:hypothetical protein
LKHASEREVRHFLELWVAEGIPFAFQLRPLLFQAARDFLAARLQVSAREITIIGSSRIGYSMSPTEDFGRAFHPRSDLDFTAISSALFERVAADARAWVSEYQGGIAQPTEAERRWWEDNARRLPTNLARGFVDTHYVPNRPRYVWPSKVAQALWVLAEKLKRTDGAQWGRRQSLRVYRDWDTFMRQLTANTMRLRSHDPRPPPPGNPA